MNIVTGDFTTISNAEGAVRALKNALFDDQDIGILVHDRQKGDVIAGDLGRQFVPGEAPPQDLVTDTKIYDRLPNGYISVLHQARMTDDAVHWYQQHLDQGDILLVVNSHDRMNDAANIVQQHGGALFNKPPMTGTPTATMPGAQTTTATQREVHLPVIEEEVAVEKTRHQVGEVSVTPETSTRGIDVPTTITHEEIRVERRALDKPLRPDEYLGSTQQEGVIRMPIVEEEVHVTKAPIIREELVITRTPVTETQTLHEQVMRAEPYLETTGDVNVTDVPADEKKHRPAA